MSFDQNSVTISGNLTRDAELKYTQNGTASIQFCIANTRTIKKGDAYEDVPMYFDVQKYGKAAETIHKDLTKGRTVSVTGELRQDRWESDQGEKKSKIYISAEKVVLGRTPKNHSSGYNPGNRTGEELRQYQDEHIDAKGTDFEDDIPF